MTTFYYWQSDKNNQWYWHLKSNGNNKIIADCAEGYRNKADCLAGIALVKGSSMSPVFQYS